MPTFTLTAVDPGPAGNAITFAVTGPPTHNLPFVITVVGSAISVQVATDNTGTSTTLCGDMFNALQADPAVAALVTMSNNDTPALPFTSPIGPFNLAGGTDSGSPGLAQGLGIKFRDPSLKAYMNDYVPIELIFGFDNSQTPGLVYPEIYIPAQNQMEFDIAGLIPSIVYPGDTLTLTLKGMKVYR